MDHNVLKLFVHIELVSDFVLGGTVLVLLDYLVYQKHVNYHMKCLTHYNISQMS